MIEYTSVHIKIAIIYMPTFMNWIPSTSQSNTKSPIA